MGDPASVGLLAAMAGGQALGSIFAPEGQELQSFRGDGYTDPITGAKEVKGLLADQLEFLQNRAEEPITLRTTVNPLPAFVGGALPMTIAAPGMDPNRLNPELRTNRSNPANPMPRRRLELPDTRTSGSNAGGAGGNDQALTQAEAAAEILSGRGRPVEPITPPPGPRTGRRLTF